MDSSFDVVELDQWQMTKTASWPSDDLQDVSCDRGATRRCGGHLKKVCQLINDELSEYCILECKATSPPASKLVLLEPRKWKNYSCLSKWSYWRLNTYWKWVRKRRNRCVFFPCQSTWLQFRTQAFVCGWDGLRMFRWNCCLWGRMVHPRLVFCTPWVSRGRWCRTRTAGVSLAWATVRALAWNIHWTLRLHLQQNHEGRPLVSSHQCSERLLIRPLWATAATIFGGGGVV